MKKMACFRDFQGSVFIFLAPIDNRTHPALVLRSSYINEEVGVNKKYSNKEKRNI
jgi:hypothetical protein